MVEFMHTSSIKLWERYRQPMGIFAAISVKISPVGGMG